MTFDLAAALDIGQFTVLAAIFYRLGGLTKAHDDFSARLGKLENA
ncbi:hypothetical protein [uncultured Celeribacter sp.]|nr:hypothetical protein [uncultured Celeribacter sp.]